MSVRTSPRSRDVLLCPMMIRAGEKNGLAVARLPNKPPATIRSNEADHNRLLCALQKSWSCKGT